MSSEPPAQPVLPIAKSLLLEALGRPFLTYVLDAQEFEIEAWLSSDSEELGCARQTAALRELIDMLRAVAGAEHIEFQPRSLTRLLGLYHGDLHTTLANAVRVIATGVPVTSEKSSTPQELLTRLAKDAYPLFLLPKEAKSDIPGSSLSLFYHPAHSRFEAAVLRDNVLKKLFTEEDETLGKFGYAMRSTGIGGPVQLNNLATALIQSGWREACITSLALPTVDQYIEATCRQLEVVSNALAGKVATVPVRVAFTGVRLVSEQPIDLGWGLLRPADEREQHIPVTIEGKLTGTGADGRSVVIDYNGNVILETTVPYRLIRREFKLGEQEWPIEIRSYEEVQNILESVQLGALLSQEHGATVATTVMPTWRYIHDPLGYGYSMSWSDPKMGRAFMPKEISERQAEEWKRYAKLVHERRVETIDVAINRTLRASAERRDFVDVLVDSVIAWENLVGSKNGEPTLRVSGALAWLLEPDDPSKRISLRTELANLYNLRSNAVHGSDLASERELVKKAQRALLISIEALRVLLTDRSELLKECKGGDARSNRLLMGC